MGGAVNLRPSCPEVSVSPGWAPPCLPCRGVTWRQLKLCLHLPEPMGSVAAPDGPQYCHHPWQTNSLSPLSKAPFHFGLCLLFIVPSNIVLAVTQLRSLLIWSGFWRLDQSLPSHAMILGDFTICVFNEFSTLVPKLPDVPICQLPAWLPAGHNQHHLRNLQSSLHPWPSVTQNLPHCFLPPFLFVCFKFCPLNSVLPYSLNMPNSLIYKTTSSLMPSHDL